MELIEYLIMGNLSQYICTVLTFILGTEKEKGRMVEQIQNKISKSHLNLVALKEENGIIL